MLKAHLGPMQMFPRFLVCFLLLTSAMPVEASVGARNSGIDLSVSAFEIQYDDSLDENKYRIFSSASIPTRSDNLYAIDGVLFVASTLTLRVNNAGTNTATGVSTTVAIIHDEYGDFEIYNETKSVSSINGQSSIDFSFQITPDYAGNHTMVVTLSSLQVDDNPADNRFQRHFTVAAFYEVFDDINPWTLATPWQQNSQAALSNPNSLHAGNGQGSTYQPNSFGNALFFSGLKWVVMLAPLGIVFYMSFGINKMSAAKAQSVFWIFAALMGLSLSWILLVYTGVSVARVFFITSATFGAMSIYGYTTKRDLTKLGSFLMMGLIGIIIASLVNIFLKSSMMYFVISILGVLIFVGLTAYDTQKIKNMYAASDTGELMGKKAVMGALTLYLDFINLFIMLLRLFGQRR